MITAPHSNATERLLIIVIIYVSLFAALAMEKRMRVLGVVEFYFFYFFLNALNV